MLYYIDKNRYHFIKEYREQFSEFAFQEVARPVRRPSRYILEILLSCRYTLVAQNCQVSVRLHHWRMYIRKTIWEKRLDKRQT